MFPCIVVITCYPDLAESINTVPVPHNRKAMANISNSELSYVMSIWFTEKVDAEEYMPRPHVEGP